jgi:glycosyltransferase involved in cell wall biosynthesis
MRILVATDAWLPHVNGAVRTLTAVASGLESLGVEVAFLTPRDMPAGALMSPGRVAARIGEIKPDAIHIATEGPIGLATRWYCRSRARPFTTSVHSRLADYAAARWSLPPRLGWSFMRWFHNGGHGTMVPTASFAEELAARGFKRVQRWPRGVDTTLFRPRLNASLGLLRPIFLAVGRLTPEKNLAAFLALDLPGTKVVVGEGPARNALARCCPNAVFLGTHYGDDLARTYAAADVLVFPSRADTCGHVLLEALACGTPIAGFPVAAMRDAAGSAPVAALDTDLRAACLRALALSRTACRAHAETMSWEASARCFLDNVERAAIASTTAPALVPAADAARAKRKAAAPAIS